VNCLERHLAKNGNKVAIRWQGEKDEDVRRITYAELHEMVCRFTNVLLSKGIKKGDRICVYMPMIPEAAVALLSCARIGAIHSFVFGGFSAEALKTRIQDSGNVMAITTDVSYRAGKAIGLKSILDEALKECPTVKNCIVYKRGDGKCNMQAGRDSWWDEETKKASPKHEAKPMNAEDPLFILYTSGSTGKPKGVLHTTAGYILHSALSHRLIFDCHVEDIYWCTADIGWVTGHSYIVYGPLANGSTSIMFEGVPTYPDSGRFWQIIAKHKVTIFYTAPTAIRSLMREGEEWPKKHDLSSLRILGSVGEPINPEAWLWYHRNIGKGNCPIVDTWWQTETGGILITPLPGAHTLKPGSASRPFFGVEPIVVDNDGKECATNEGGKLCIKKPWPGMARTMWGDHERFIDTYFAAFPNLYYTGDGCRVDQDGDYWLMGRVDDVVNISGHRIGTAEVESALVSHPKVSEAAVVGYPHDIKGSALYAYVTVKEGVTPSDELKKELIAHVRKEIGPIAQPDKIQFSDAMPKTRSGKIMRRILRKIAENETGNLGDVSTLADPSVVERLIKGKQ
jgi:acetyl-CoA synthetase